MLNVVALSLEWARELPSRREGCSIKICGSGITSAMDLSSRHFVKAATAPFQMLSNRAGTGPSAWVMTPTQNSTFSHSNGSRPQEPPMGYVAEFLQVLHSYGYRVVGTHSLCTGENNMYPIMIWTLQK